MSEQLSALIDGELTEAEALRLIRALKSNDQFRQTWNMFHLVGDALRKAPQVSADFSAKVARQLASEPTVLAPRQRKATQPAPRFALPIAASMAALSLVGVLAWQMVQLSQRAAPAQQVAQATTDKNPPMQIASAQMPNRVKFSKAASNPYLLAHQEFSPTYAMEGIPAYVRMVSEEQAGN
ncbi:MAG: sigma-E factor negative regulatory protein [Burkholderiales bacterium]